MPGLYGHVAMGLLFALPAWFVWDGRTSAAFVAFVLVTVTLPDLDLVFQNMGFPVKHHGVTHTVVFVAAFAVVVGGVVATALRPVLQRWWRTSENEVVKRETIYAFVIGGLLLGGLSHLFADILGADNAEPVEPLWPVVQEPVEIGVAHYASFWLNTGLLVAAVALHVAAVSAETLPLETRFREWTAELPDVDPE